MRVRLVITVTLVAGGLCGRAQADQSMSADQANTVARAINLAAGDLSGYTGSPNVTTADARREQARMFRCAGVLPRSRAVVDLSSQDFQMAGSGSGESALSVVA